MLASRRAFLQAVLRLWACLVAKPVAETLDRLETAYERPFGFPLSFPTYFEQPVPPVLDKKVYLPFVGKEK